MSTRRSQQHKGVFTFPDGVEPEPKGGGSDPRLIRAPELDTCNLLVEVISPAFDPNRVLLRRVFFIDEDKSKYVSVGYYPTRNYQPLVEIVGLGKMPIILTDQHVANMAEHLALFCEAMCGNEYYICKDGEFRMNTTGGYRVARLYLDEDYIRFKLTEFR